MWHFLALPVTMLRGSFAIVFLERRFWCFGVPAGRWAGTPGHAVGRRLEQKTPPSRAHLLWNGQQRIRRGSYAD